MKSRFSDYMRGILHGVLIVALASAPAYMIGQQSNTGRNYTNTWAVPSGTVFLIVSGGCPAGSTQVTALDGAMPLGTLAAHGDIGATGGADNITPAGTNGTAAFTPGGTVDAAVFTGSGGTTSATSGGTPAGTVGAPVVTWPVGVPTFSGNALGTHTHDGGSYSAAAQNFTGSSATSSAVSAGTPAGTNGTVTGPAQVISWPAGVPTNASGAFTPGAISWPAGVPTISGTTINSFSSVINHTHTITVTSLVQGGTTAATTGTHIMTSTATGGSARAPTSGDSFTATSANPAGGVASITPTINAPGAIAWPAGVPTEAAGNFTQPTISWPGGVPTNATSTIPAETFTGSALGTHTHTLTATGTNASSAVSGSSGATSAGTPAGTVAWPAGVPTNSAPDFTGSALGTHTHTLTPAGTINAQNFAGTPGTVPAEAFSGTQFDNRSAFVKVIYCQRT